MKNANNTEDNPFGYPISDEEDSLLSSLVALGAVIGPVPYSLLSDRIGRKITLQVLGISHVITYIMLAFGKVIYLYYVARVIAGAAVAGIFTLVPVYIGEVSANKNRGMLSTVYSVVLAIGVLFGYAVGPYVNLVTLNIIAAVPPAVFIALSVFLVPESPYYLVSAGSEDLAARVLSKLRGSSNAEDKEIVLIKDEVVRNSKGNVLDLFRSKGPRKAFVIVNCILLFQQLSGITIILLYAQTIFEATGSSLPAEVNSIIIGAIQFGGSFITPLLIDKLGRKILLIISAIGMCLSEIPLGLYFYLQDDTEVNVDSFSWLPLVSLVSYTVLYNFGFGMIPWALIGEVFNVRVKAIAASLTATICYGFTFLVLFFFIPIRNAVGMGVLFWIISAMCLFAALFSFTCVPETKGKSLQEIQNELEGKKAVFNK